MDQRLLTKEMKHLLAITIALLPSAVLAEQFTPEQMLDVMTKSPSNRDVRVQDNSANWCFPSAVRSRDVPCRNPFDHGH